jgi:hypothetical protein
MRTGRVDTRFKVLAAGSFTWILALSGVARADEPMKVGEPRVMSEPGEVTDVVDAFDGDDVFDLHLTLGYQYSTRSANVRRESAINSAMNPGLSSGDFTATNMNVAKYNETTSRLNTRADIGLYHDIALYLRMPIILSNDRKLSDLNGSAAVQDITAMGANGERLFTIPFNAPQRSGIEYLAVGFDFAFMNQWRDRTKPTWMAGFEGRFGVAEPLHACNADATPQCAFPTDVNRNGTADGRINGSDLEEGVFAPGGRSPGVSRGTTGLELHSFISRRIKYIEPYAGFRTLFEFPQDKSDFGSTDLKGSLVNHPPLQGWVYAGLQVIPWEQREQFQRVTFDGRVGASYRSEGRDYSELFDALGSSSAPSIRRPAFASYKLEPSATDMSQSVADPNSQKVYFTGLTDVSAYMGWQAAVQVTWQAGEYIKFTAGGSYTREQGHIITADQPCNPDFASDIGTSGPCRNEVVNNGSKTVTQTGIPNPNYRPTIDAVGRRFRTEDSNLLDAWVMGIVMF